jgi:hypothetical protein
MHMDRRKPGEFLTTYLLSKSIDPLFAVDGKKEETQPRKTESALTKRIP